MRSSQFIILIFFFLESCVDPLSIKLPPETVRFVVDGLITNDPGPYEVKLSYTLGFNNTTLKKPPLATGASVWIYDNFNNSEKLSETSPGVYQTSSVGMRGQIGRTYYIQIKTKFGREYQSSPQRLSPAGEIEKVSFEFEAQSLKGNKPNEYVDGVKIIVDSKAVANEQNLMRWRWSTIFKARTWPELRTTVDPFNPKILHATPEPCSGFVRGGTPSCDMVVVGECIRKVAECSCCECWPYNYNTKSLISHNRVIDGLEFKGVDLGNIPVGPQEFYEKYYLKIEQLSLSEEVYDFWNLVEAQQTASGSLFQPNSAQVRGNIHSITDPNEEVLGIFGVSGITKKELFLTPEVVPYRLPPLDSIYHNCSDSFQNNYKVKPSFW